MCVRDGAGGGGGGSGYRNKNPTQSCGELCTAERLQDS